jgi:hypothetical protein
MAGVFLSKQQMGIADAAHNGSEEGRFTLPEAIAICAFRHYLPGLYSPLSSS